MGGGGDNCHRPGDRCCLMKPCARRGFAPDFGARPLLQHHRGVELGGFMFGTFARRSLVAGWVLAAVVAACAPKDGIIGPPSGLIYGISDAAHGGTPGFYFLPPMALQPAFSGTFDADITTLDPRVAICDVTISYDVDCGGSSTGATPAVAVFTTTTTPAITLDLATPQYQVSWDTHCTGCLAGHVYRVHVIAGAAGTRRELGYADVFLTSSSGTVKVTGDLIVRNAGRTLPIHFRIETAIPAGLAVSAATPDDDTRYRRRRARCDERADGHGWQDGYDTHGRRDARHGAGDRDEHRPVGEREHRGARRGPPAVRGQSSRQLNHRLRTGGERRRRSDRDDRRQQHRAERSVGRRAGRGGQGV